MKLIEELLDNDQNMINVVRKHVKDAAGYVSLTGNKLYNHRRSMPREQQPPQTWELSNNDALGTPLLPAYFGRYGCDTPPSLFWSILESIKNDASDFEFLLHSGDLTAHYWLPEHDHLRFLAAAIASGMLRQIFTRESPNITDWDGSSLDFLDRWSKQPSRGSRDSKAYPQWVMAIGNNDLEGDYVVEENSSWNADFYELWKGWVVPLEEQDNFIRGMYYKRSFENMDILVINSVWYHHLAVNGQGTSVIDTYDGGKGDPAGQLAWLKRELDNSMTRNRPVLIVGHVPPAKSLFRNTYLGFSVDTEWNSIWAKKYEEILDRYRHIVKGQYFGHIHTDEFRLEMDKQQKSEPKGLILIAPSVSPNHANNPSWRKVSYSVGPGHDLEIVTYEQHYGALYGYQSHGGDEYYGSFDKTTLLKIDHVYDTHHTIGPIRALTPKAVYREIHDYILRSQKRTSKWWQNQLVYGGGPPAFVIRCVLMEHFEIHHDIRKCVRDVIAKGTARPKNLELHTIIS